MTYTTSTQSKRPAHNAITDAFIKATWTACDYRFAGLNPMLNRNRSILMLILDKQMMH